MKMELFTVSSKNANAYLTNIDIIKAGQSSGIFSITNSDNSDLNQCKITSTNSSVELPFEAVTLAQEGKVLALGSAVFPLQEQSCYCIPFTATSDIPAGACVLQLEQVQFKYHDEHQANSCRRLSQGCTAEKSANIPDTSAAHNLELE